MDSLLAYSQGPLRVTSDLDLGQLREPAFNLGIQAKGARIINRDDARIQVDADLTVSGPFDGVQVDGTIEERKSRRADT